VIELLALPALTTLGAAGLELAAKFDPVPTMARVRIFGSIFPAKVLKDNGDGTYQMEAKQASARTAVGTVFTATAAEVVEMAAAEIPPSGAVAQPDSAVAAASPTPAASSDGTGALEAAMAEERKTLPTPADILAAFRQDKGIVTKGQATTAPGVPASAGVSVQPGPTAALPAPKPAGSTHMPHLADKLKQLATGTSGFAAALEAKVDTALAAHSAAQTSIMQQVDDAFAQVDAINADAQAGVAAITAELAKVTN
jgi:hypothetical protein